MNITDYYKDLKKWEKEISEKDGILVKTVKKPVKEEKKVVENKDKPITNKVNPEPVKRDYTNMKDYYSAWDKYKDEENDTADDREIVQSEMNFMKNPKAYKQNEASKNIQVTINSNRMAVPLAVKLNQLKEEANAHFLVKNFTKAVEILTSAVKMMNKKELSSEEEEIKIAILSNRAWVNIKNLQFREAVLDLDIVLASQKDNVKAFFRRGLALHKIGKFLNARDDYLTAIRLVDDESVKVTIAENLNITLNSLEQEAALSKQNMEVYEPEGTGKNVTVVQINSEEEVVELEEPLKKETQARKRGEELANKKKDDLNSFAYDVAMSNLTASSFKYAFRNFKEDTAEKDKFLLVSK